VFSDDFHLITLQSLLKCCAKLESGVDVKAIISSLADRLVRYVQTAETKPTQNIFTLFNKYTHRVIDAKKDMPLEHVLALQVSLQNLALRCYPDKLEYVDQVLKFATERIAAVRNSSSDPLPRPVLDQAMKLLNIPLETFKNILLVLQLTNYPALIDLLDYDNRRRIAISIIKSCLDYATVIPDVESCQKLLALLKPLLSDAPDKKEVDDEDFADEQNLVAQLIHLLRSNDIEQMFGILITLRKALEQGGPRRRVFTHPPMFFSSMRLVQVMLGQSGVEVRIFTALKQLYMLTEAFFLKKQK